MAHFHEGCLQGRRGVSIRQSSLLLGRGGGSSNCLVVFADEFPQTVPMAAVGADAGVAGFHMSADGVLVWVILFLIMSAYPPRTLRIERCLVQGSRAGAAGGMTGL